MTRALRPEAGQHRLAHPEDSEDIGLELVPDLLFGGLLDHAEVPEAALFATTSIRPKAATTSCTAAKARSRSVTSSWTASAVPGCARDQVLDRVSVACGEGDAVAVFEGRLAPASVERQRRWLP